MKNTTDTMKEVHQTTKDEYGMKARGVLSSLEKFEVLFGMKLAHFLFSPSEETFTVLQAKDTSFQEAISAVTDTKAFYAQARTHHVQDTLCVLWDKWHTFRVI